MAGSEYLQQTNITNGKIRKNTPNLSVYLVANRGVDSPIKKKLIFIALAVLLMTNLSGCGPSPTKTPHSPTVSFNVKDYGAQGDGITDDTAAIQAAVDYAASQGGGNVFIPPGIYLVNPDISVHLKNNTALNIASNAILKAKSTSSGEYAIVNIDNVSNAGVVGGSIVGERDAHTGATGEWGMGISVSGSNNITITDISISKCWGDGIYIGSGTQNYCNNVVIERFKIDNNRRNGISVISAKNLTISDGVISNTKGTDPQSGLDLEPNSATEFLQNVAIENLQTEHNAGYGIELWLGARTHQNNAVPSSNVSIRFQGCTDSGSVGGSMYNVPDYQVMGYNITAVGDWRTAGRRILQQLRDAVPWWQVNLQLPGSISK